MYSDIIIIGGGASGLLAAIGAESILMKSDSTLSVTVLEKMPRVARKMMITGKGRCNFTNVKPWEEFSAHIRTKKNFLRPAFYNLTPESVIGLLEDAGLPCQVERGDRAFPVSHRASDVVDTLRGIATRWGARIEQNVEVKGISVNRSSKGDIFMIAASGSRSYSCRRLILSTGGLSYPGTGSTGDGYRFAESFGHKITECFPSLTAMVPKGYKDASPEKNGHLDRSAPLSSIGKALCGIQLKNVSLTLSSGGNTIASEMGDMDFTDGGIEGPIGFSLSRDCVKSVRNGGKPSLSLDLKPAIEKDDLRERLRGLWKEIGKDPRSSKMPIPALTRVLLGKLMPRELIQGFLICNPEILKGRKGNERIDLDCLTDCLKGWAFPVEGYVGYERCVVTAGGVSTDEVLPKTMESRLQTGLHICGELLDIDCDTGGYNLQAAFSTGYLAGQSAAISLEKEDNG